MPRTFEEAYFEGAGPADVEAVSAADRGALARSHRELAAGRMPGTARVRVSNPSRATAGWDSPHTVIEIVMDDMPFIVDSVTAFLARGGFEVFRLLHPVIDGESFVHVEIPRESDVATLHALGISIESVLDDVRAAVSDWEAMRARVRSLADAFRSAPASTAGTDDIAEVVSFLEWLVDDHFTFLGAGGVRADRLGVARHRLPVGLPGADESRVLTLTKARERSTVHRAVPLDYVGVTRIDEFGAVTGLEWFVGLYTADVYSASPSELPIVRRKTAEIVRRAGYARTGHDARTLGNVLATFPRDEVFRLSVDDLFDVSLGVVRMGERRTVRLFVTGDPWHRFVSCLVYLPRDRYTTPVRVAMLDALRHAFGGTDLDFNASVTESVLARLHVVVQTDGVVDVDVETLERTLANIARAWTDELRDALIAERGEELGLDAYKIWADAFPPAYQADVSAIEAVRDIAILEAGAELSIRLVLGKPGEAPRLDLYHRGGPLLLSDVMPLLEHLDVTVIDERPYTINPAGVPSSFIYSFGVRPSSEEVLLDASTQTRLSDLFRAVWAGDAENDALNALVLCAGLTARQVALIRALVKYLHQAGLRFGEASLTGALTRNPGATRLLVDLFAARFDPDLYDDERDVDRDRHANEMSHALLRAIDDVVTLDDDRILRALTEVVHATVRTNAYQPGARAALAFKLDPAKVGFLPTPRPEHEIWVCSPRVEAVHLRGGDVARGGIRWSDRRDDFRTEVLGLMKAQMEKNAVIVPAGAKGGFVVKQPPSDDAALRAEVLACYQIFVRALLDLTDNIVDGHVVPPGRTVRHDREDPYLVVAADRGTASFSDVANALAVERDYWLGDAFASGGSTGYDHKAMGITSRGVWVAVRAHFGAMGVDADTAPLTVVGIGDMSGDVFGNGLLRSRHLRLVAAFDHRHVFIDPDPDPEVSFRERQRLFELPRSSWADYNPALISPGGGVFARDAKACALSVEVRRALGIGDDVSAPTPDELVKAVLRAPVDLLWNGGIGTFVKASTESHADVADRANDPIRIDANELCCKVVAEGGNLGLTQLARVEYALTPSPFRGGAGGRVNTDAIDNSAGVDCSDHEVNIKIVLRDAIAAGRLSADDRVPLLVEMTDDVAALVLADNDAQTTALEIAAVEAPDMVGVHARQIERLEQAALVDRRLEGLPTPKALQERHAAGLGLTSPELAVLLAFTKLNLERALLASDVPDDPYFRPELLAYFPSALRERFADLVDAHVLRREIVSTVVANAVVNRAGISFLARLADEIGAGLPSIARAHVLARDIFGMNDTWTAIDELDLETPAATQDFMFLAARRVVERAARWLLRHEADLDLQPTLDRYRPSVASLLADLPDLFVGDAATEFAARHEELLADGVPVALARQVAAFGRAHDALAIAAIAARQSRGSASAVSRRAARRSPEVEQRGPAAQPRGAESSRGSIDDVARVHFTVAARLRLDWLRDHIAALPRGDRWQIEARAALRDDVSDLHALLTEDVLRTTDPQRDATSRVEQWMRTHAGAVQRHTALLTDIETGGVYDLATLGSARRELRDLVGLSPDVG